MTNTPIPSLRGLRAKSRARAARAKEEVLLLKEEMRRVLQYLEWKSRWWRDRQTLGVDVSRDLAEGIRGYAISQAEVQESLAKHFRKLWEAPLKDSIDDITTNVGQTRHGQVSSDEPKEAFEDELEEEEEDQALDDGLEYISDDDDDF
ncbi:hypothetical protein CPC08DRAFT_720776 [Agrocybe pediades]|nr:hypothetical protein CPC08DRAFT_720776 [Agrocybe pediades]